MSETSEYYTSKVAVVTGGASGIGLALAETMLSYGSRKVVLADFNDENLKRETERLNAANPGKVLGLHCNVTKETDVQGMIQRAMEFGGGRIDFLFNNAGAGLGGHFDEQTNEDWEKAFALNFYGALYGIRAVLPIMRAQGGGHRRGSDESAQYGLRLFQQLNLQLLIVTPLQKIHIIEPFVANVGFVHNEGGRASRLRNLAIEEYRAEKARLAT